MRSRPATWTALFSRNVLSPISTHEAWGSSSLTCAPKSARKRCHSADTLCEANFAGLSAALRWPTASPAVCGGLCEEAATPGQPVSRRNAFWRNPPGNSPSRIARNRRLCRNAQAGHAEHLAGCEHFAPRTNALQAKTRTALCRICGWLRFFVESAGKNGMNSMLVSCCCAVADKTPS